MRSRGGRRLSRATTTGRLTEVVQEIVYRPLPGMDGAYLQHVVFEGAPFPSHLSEGFGICLLREGSADVFLRRGWQRTGPGIYLVNPDDYVVVGDNYNERTVTDTLWIEPNALARLIKTETGHQLTGVFDAYRCDDGRLRESLASLFLSQESITDLGQQCRALELVAMTVRNWGRYIAAYRTPLRMCSVKRAVEILEDCPQENITLDRLAGECEMSRFQLIRAFNRRIGVSPHQYQVHVRVRRAKYLLRRGLPLKDVAAQCGFSDQSHFTRLFKKHVGVTPGQILQLNRERSLS